MLCSLTVHRQMLRRPWISCVRSVPIHTSRSPLLEFFVIVWDKPHADRTKSLSPNFNAPFFTFAGEMLDAQPSGPTQDTLARVRGNCFACHARDTEDVKQKMRSTSYYKEDIWDMSTAQISPLETVHTSKFSLAE